MYLQLVHDIALYDESHFRWVFRPLNPEPEKIVIAIGIESRKQNYLAVAVALHHSGRVLLNKIC